MILETAKLNRIRNVMSKKTGLMYTVKMVRRSDVSPKMDVFLIRETGNYVWRDSIRRNYQEI